MLTAAGAYIRLCEDGWRAGVALKRLRGIENLGEGAGAVAGADEDEDGVAVLVAGAVAGKCRSRQ